MPSLRAKLLNAYIRMRMKPMRLHEIDPPKLREWAERNVVPILPKGVSREAVRADGVSGEWIRPDAGAERTILYLHGGGYVFGSPRTHRTLTYALALAAGANVFAARYRLAPKHRCPAAIEDAVATYEWLLAQGADSARIVIGGDSAGGGLTLATMIALRDKGVRLPAGAILYSPWTDLAVSGETLDTNAKNDAMFNRDSIIGGPPKYLGDLEPKDPRASPLYADLKGLPPLLVFASESEMLYSDSIRLVERARAAGVDVRFESRPGLVHVWPLFNPFMPEAKEAAEISGAFARRVTGAMAQDAAA